MADALSSRLAAKLASQLLDAMIASMTPDEMDIIVRGGPGDWNLLDCTTEELHRLERGEPPELVLDPSRRNPP